MSKKSYDLPNIQRPEDVELYLKSFNLGRTQQAEIDRTAAFGAIRRAAEVARNADSTWEEWDEYTDPDVSIPAFQEGVRRAIRAAIGTQP